MARRGTAVLGADDAKWRAECDMRTLREAEQIKADAKRAAAARAAAEKEIEAMKTVVRRTPVAKTTRGKK